MFPIPDLQGDSKVIPFARKSCPERHKAPSKGGEMRASVGFSARYCWYFGKTYDN